ncbi:hypothetical protein XaC1_251 [Xanthomonas phage XaC1]|nr:hypothetical protein XaC1_251 [Xanthomonas phage XaC1]
MRKDYSYSVHKFSSLENCSFDPKMYSFLKFGCDKAARMMGYELADSFFADNKKELLDQRLVVIPSPYNYVKNAATVMSEHFVNRLNHHLVQNGSNSVEWVTINRKVSYIKDYGFLDAESRRKLIDGDEFYFSTGFVEGKKLIFIDDVCITGTHEDKLKEILDKNHLQNDSYFLYFAQYNGSPGNANIEGALNFSGVTGLDDFIKLTKEKEHHVIVRPIKYLMGQDHSVFKDVLEQLPQEYSKKLYNGCLAENYHMIDSYKNNFEYLSSKFN